MGLIELIIVILVLFWLFGYFGRGRWYGTGWTADATPWYGGSLIHLIIVLAVILLILRLLRVV